MTIISIIKKNIELVDFLLTHIFIYLFPCKNKNKKQQKKKKQNHLVVMTTFNSVKPKKFRGSYFWR